MRKIILLGIVCMLVIACSAPKPSTPSGQVTGPKAVVTTNSCEDSDGGLNPSLSGRVSGFLDNQAFDEVDVCGGEILAEHYCDGSIMLVKNIRCPNGCRSGACLD